MDVDFELSQEIIFKQPGEVYNPKPYPPTLSNLLTKELELWEDSGWMNQFHTIDYTKFITFRHRSEHSNNNGVNVTFLLLGSSLSLWSNNKSGISSLTNVHNDYVQYQIQLVYPLRTRIKNVSRFSRNINAKLYPCLYSCFLI